VKASLDAALSDVGETAAARDEARERAARLAAEVEAGAGAATLLGELRAQTHRLDGEVRELLEHRARHEAALWRIEMLERDLAASESERHELNAALGLHAETTTRSAAALEHARAELASERQAAGAIRDQLTRSEAAVVEQASRIEELAETERLLSGRVLHLQDTLQAVRAELQDEQDSRARIEEALHAARGDAAEIAGSLRALRLTRRSRLAHALRRLARRAMLRPTAPSALDRSLAIAERPAEFPSVPLTGETGVRELTRL
jgi:chromosome segregation ATPase